jgi:ketosteroid isomerase-like protein
MSGACEILGCGMASRNVDLTRRAIEAYNERDIKSFRGYCDPSVVIRSVFAAVGGGVSRGHPGVRELWRDLEEAWGEEIRAEPETFVDLGDRTLVHHALRGRGHQGGADVALPGALVFRWRDGLIVNIKSDLQRGDVLSELGVSEGELEPIAP